MIDVRYPEWQRQYRDAMLEIDSGKLAESVARAETAIFLRLQTLANSPDGSAERQAIDGALEALRILKRDRLGFPDWPSAENDDLPAS